MRHRLPVLPALAVASASLLPPCPLPAQQPPVTVTAEDYARAESFLAGRTGGLVFGASVQPNWLPGDRFWYRNTISGGTEFILVDPAAGTRARAFDHERLAAAIGAATGSQVGPLELPFRTFELTESGDALTARVGGSATQADGRSPRTGDTHLRCDLRAYTCSPTDPAPDPDPNAIPSPDGTKAAFIRDHNLWLRDLDTGAETPLTTDGIEDYGYATNNAGWVKRDSPVLLWSPASDMIATFQHDARGVGMMHMTTTNVGHPELESWKYPLPGDSLIFRISRVVIHVGDPGADRPHRVVRLQMPPDPHRSSTTDHVAGRGGVFLDVEWSADGSQLAFLSNSRDHKHAQLRVADPHTGEVRDVLGETEETFFESGSGGANWRVLKASNEVIWFSKRHNWGHLYRYDLSTGALLDRITTGDWNVRQLLRVDEEARTLYFTGTGREPGDPYFQYLYRIGMDGSGLTLLTPDSANHTVSLSPTGAYFVDSHSTPVIPPVTVVRDMDGSVVAELERADISALLSSGWQPPEPFTVKARDGETDLHGLMYRPTHFDPAQSYPVVNYLYPGPQSGSVGSRSFRASRGDKQALAELGFIVVEVDAMGTPGRSKAFHDAYYGNMGDNGLPDQVGMVRQLGARHPWMDLDRVGIWGHSGGGFASTAGILRYPDFYKVAVSQAGNHDNRNYEDDWGEKWQGLLETYPDGTTNYDNQANQLVAENLQGKLLLAHGTMDTNVPLYNTLLVVDALIAADKDFDLIMLPNRGHGFSSEPYMMRRRWDYFVRHLLGTEPPEYTIGAGRRPVS
ncbi:MAG: DPP IV N-terminal domain-containing protein [Gemmatimonadetes bacterium]|nr:DPP IV N-terminal domain-containing protein [Gemmatimonadota bacterium]